MALPIIIDRPERELIRLGETYPYFTSAWTALHNPVIYKIQNDKWPTNSVDTPESITAQADNGGNVEFTIAGHSFVALEWVKIEDSTVDDYNGVWQIIEIDTNTITLDLAYTAGAIGTPTATKYYYNYHTIVDIWAGIPAWHVFNSEKPIKFIASIKVKPNLSNISIVDVAGIVLDTVNLDNELNEDDLNIWTSFYIIYREGYDAVSSGEVQNYVSNGTSDAGNHMYGMNAKRAFQNAVGGNMGQYVICDQEDSLFLTHSDRIFAGYYWDLNFIADISVTYAEYYLTEYDLNGNTLNTASTQVFLGASEGVYRVRMDQYSFNSNTKSFDIYLRDSLGNQISEIKRIYLDTSCSRQDIYLTWLNNLGGWEYWKFTAEKDYNILIEDQETFNKNIFQDWDLNYVDGEDWEAVSMIDAREGLRVRSQLLTLEEVQTIAKIKHSIKVQEITITNQGFPYTFPIQFGVGIISKRTVIIEKSDLKIRQDGDKLFSIEFDLRYTDKIPVQNA